VPLHFALEQGHASAVPLKALVTVRNALGWEIARADALLATANQRTTDQLNAGDVVSAYPLLRLPFGAPPGDYQVYVRIYDESEIVSGLEPLGTEEGMTSGRDVLLGMWSVGAGADWPATGRASMLPYAVNISLGEPVTLLAHDLDAQLSPRRNGDLMRMTLLWQANAPLPMLTLRAVDQTWATEIPAMVTDARGIVLDWRQVRVPLGAASGQAELLLSNDTVLARFTVVTLPAIVEAPEVEQVVDAEVSGLARLFGYTLHTPEVDADNLPRVTLVWEASAADVETAYTVFVQLLDSSGVVLAQSDAMAAGGMRPTTTWRSGEFIIDEHTLHWNVTPVSGSAMLIVGLYDAGTNVRLTWGDGEDFLRLPSVLQVR
jgi:hypothetical protein